jgi:hypothetical protein
MTISEFLSLPEKPGTVRSLISGRLFRRPVRRADRQRRAAVERLLQVLRRDGGPELRTDYLIRHEPQDLFPVEIAAVPTGNERAALVVLIPRPAETIGETHDKVKACLAAGVEQVWELEFYSQYVTVHRNNGDKRNSFKGEEALVTPAGLSIVTPNHIFKDLPEPESSLPDGMDELWVDILREKHECYGMKHTATIDVSVAGRTVQLIVPDHLAETEIVTAALGDGLLFAVGREGNPWDRDEYLGVVMAARQQDHDTYLVHVWHALYPYALKYLGVETEVGEPTDT